RRLGFAAKGGSNDEPHNHNDLGSFVLVLDGIEVLCDLGAGEYTRDYFGEKRWDVFCVSSFGHSLPIIDGRGQSAGCESRAENARCAIEGGSAVFSLELSSAYRCPGLLGFRRELSFDPTLGLSIVDEFLFSETGHSVVERFITRNPEALSLERARSPGTGQDSGMLRVEASGSTNAGCAASGQTAAGPEAVQPSIELAAHEHREHDGSTRLVTSLDFRYTGIGKILRAEVSFRL
ncbi:MAG TPA: heparinase II/III family protein, partial [Rectinemataceae bacterium]